MRERGLSHAAEFSPFPNVKPIVLRAGHSGNVTPQAKFVDFSRGNIGIDGILPLGYDRRMKLSSYLSTHKMTQAEFAERIGLSKAQLSRLVAGRRQPSPETMKRIAEATDNAVMPNDFFDLPPAPAAPPQEDAA